ncbi:37S ribosomal protein S23 mitochondrial [Cladochytrium tenue]|nr:37S ribosomal protein S23 mitochondrial [Cladochytrium tenue]
MPAATRVAAVTGSSRRRLATAAAAAATPDLPPWTPQSAVPTSAGRFFQPDAVFAAAATVTARGAPLPAAVMCRRSTLDAIGAINALAKNGEAARTKICFDGRSGSGKSSTLALLSSHYRALGWIVIHVGNVRHWLSGKEPYAFSKESGLFTQPALAARVAGEILKANADALTKVPSSTAGNMATLLRQAAARPNSAQAQLDDFLRTLFATSERAPIFVAIDSANALYGKTAYRDQRHKVLLSPQLALAKSFVDILSLETTSNAVVTCATDRTDPAGKSTFFEEVLSAVPAAAGSPTPSPFASGGAPAAPALAAHAATRRLLSPDVAASPAGAVLPEAMSPGLYHPLLPRTEVHPKGLTRFWVPGFAPDEIMMYLTHWSRAGRFHEALSENFARKLWTVTGGDIRQVRDRYVA